MKRVNFRLFALAIALVATSCVKDVVVDSNFHGTPSEKICFGAELKDTGEDTRGGVVSNRVGKHDLKSADGEFVLPMGVYVEDGIGCADAAETRGALFTNAGAISDFTVWAKHKVGENVSAYFNGIVFEKNTTDNVFYSDDEYMWPGDGELTFVAVTNAPESGFEPNYTAGSDSEPMLESFTYTVPADATAQNDIVLAKATYSGSTDASAPLTFSHIMSAVNIKIGDVTNGTIESITLKGVYNKGTYNVAANRWYPDKTSVSDYSVKFAGGGNNFVVDNNTATGSAVNASDAIFMFIPQEPGEGAVLEVVFNNGQKRSTLTGAIAGDKWEMGLTTNYNLSIDENLTLIIAPVGKKLDAHYIIAQAEVTVDGFEGDDTWTISVSDSKSESTILPEEEMNPLALQGFWTDKYVDANGNVSSDSARGASSWQGHGNVSKKKFYIFITENITGADKEVTLTLRSDKNSDIQNEKVLLQKSPNWVDGGFGWETVDDDEAGKYGFKWTRKIAYVYPYTNLVRDTPLTDYCTEFINTYGAGANNFATVHSVYGDWDEGTKWYEVNYGYRAYILLDYSTLNNVTGANSATDGYSNTLALYRASGTTASSQFETILKTTLKAVQGSGSPELFRRPSAYEINMGVPAETGQSNDLSDIMEYIQKKNRYFVHKKSHTDGEGTALVSYIPYFNEEDLKWYLPAKDQFLKFVPNPDVQGDAASNYWSSTTAGTTTAWTGTAEKDRDEVFAVIAVRKNENNVYNNATATVDNTSMQGGENGEAQWVE